MYICILGACITENAGLNRCSSLPAILPSLYLHISAPSLTLSHTLFFPLISFPSALSLLLFSQLRSSDFISLFLKMSFSLSVFLVSTASLSLRLFLFPSYTPSLLHSSPPFPHSLLLHCRPNPPPPFTPPSESIPHFLFLCRL